MQRLDRASRATPCVATGSLQKLFGDPGCRDPDPVAPFCAKEQVSLRAGVLEEVPEKLDVLSAVFLDFLDPALFPPAE